MEKKSIRSWVCFIGIIAIVSSCNSNNQKNPDNPGNPDTKDSMVGEKKEPPTSDKPSKDLIVGAIDASLTINGAAADMQPGKITIRPKSDFSAIDIRCAEGKLVLSPGWHGIGDYDKVFGEWTDNSELTRYTSDSQAPGNMKITEWSDEKIAGTFSVTVIENNSIEAPRKKLLAGEFHYVHE